MKKSLARCPNCQGKLRISQYKCDNCEIDINGDFEGCTFCGLSDEDRYFALVFLQTGGNIKDVERVMGISYPTVKQKLHNLIIHLGLANGDHHHHGVDTESVRAAKKEVKEAMKNLKNELKDMKRDIRHSVKRGVILGGMHGERFSGLKDVIHKHLKPFGDESVDNSDEATSIINDLKAGRIDVDAALSRLRGEESTGQCGQENKEIEISGEINLNNE